MHTMKNLIFSLFLCLATAGTLSAAPVDIITAQLAGKNFLESRNIPATGLRLADTRVVDNQTLYYIFNTPGKGFVIVSADDRTIPVLGYSGESAWTLFADTVYACNVRGWMESYEKQILEVKRQNLPASPEITILWKSLEDGNVTNGKGSAVPASPGTTMVAPLLNTTWDQGWPYNALCPGGAATGCVATAMGQIMAYHDYPAQGLGSYGYQWGGFPYTGADFGATTYNFAAMPGSLTGMNTPGDTAVARLLYQAGVSCRSMWGYSTGVGYSTSEDPMTRAFVNYFKYAYSTISYIQKSSYIM